MMLQYVEPAIVEGNKGIKYTKEVKEEEKKWEHGVVDYVIGRNPTIHQMRCYVASKWKEL